MDDLKDALRKIFEKKRLNLLNRTVDELRALGILLPADAIEPRATLAATDTVICMPIATGATPTLQDNKISPCAYGCGRTVEHRPWYPPGTIFACYFCAAERIEHREQ